MLSQISGLVPSLESKGFKCIKKLQTVLICVMFNVMVSPPFGNSNS